MKDGTYFNDNDLYVVRWLRNLYGQNGRNVRVAWRQIEKVTAQEVAPYRRVHLFAGIGGWERALELAGWPEEEEVWTGSCPCQPFSAAGKRGGERDPRHLWPEMRRLIAECRPPVVFGEQVASKDGRAWLAGVRADLEEMGYRVGAADLCAASCEAPHIRQRLFWVADTEHAERRTELQEDGDSSGRDGSGGRSHAGGLADTEHDGWDRAQATTAVEDEDESDGRLHRRGAGRMDHADDARLQGRVERRDGAGQRPAGSSGLGFWSDFDIIPCGDGKARRVEPGTFPLAHGVPARVGRLRAYGNAIVPQLAALFIQAYLDIRAREAQEVAQAVEAKERR